MGMEDGRIFLLRFFRSSGTWWCSRCSSSMPANWRLRSSFSFSVVLTLHAHQLPASGARQASAAAQLGSLYHLVGAERLCAAVAFRHARLGRGPASSAPASIFMSSVSSCRYFPGLDGVEEVSWRRPSWCGRSAVRMFSRSKASRFPRPVPAKCRSARSRSA